MKNGFVHNHILIRNAEQMFLALGARVAREYPVSVRGRRGAIDLRVDFPFWPIACEAENTPRRVGWDIEKARATGAAGAVILTPTWQVARACNREVQRKHKCGELGRLWVCVLTLGAFRQWLANNSRLFSPSFEVSKTLPAVKAGRRPASTHYPES